MESISEKSVIYSSSFISISFASGNAASISYTKLTDTAAKISGTLANIKSGVTVKVNDKAKGTELKAIVDKVNATSATLDLTKVEDSLVELEKVKTLLKDKTVTLTGTASAAKYKLLLDEKPTSLAGAVSDTVTALTDGKSLTLTGATSVTAVLDAGGGDKDLTGVKLDSRVSVIDLNGQAATLDADDLNNATIKINGGSYGVKDTSSNVAGLTASLYANKAVTISDTTNAADIKTLTDGKAASIAYTKLSDTADNINGTLANIKAGVEVDISDNADTTEFKAISDKVGTVGGGATLTASTVVGTIDELVTVKTLLKNHTAKFTDRASVSKFKSVLDEKPTLIQGVIEDTVAALTNGSLAAGVTAGSTEVRALLKEADKDLSSVTLDSRVTVVDVANVSNAVFNMNTFLNSGGSGERSLQGTKSRGQ